MNIVIAADIFGKTDALKELADKLSYGDIDVAIIDPYAGRRIDFADEAQAYTYFQKNTGIQRYSDTILENIKKAGQDLHLVGFSVGASAIWALSGDVSADKNIHATCFYGSQIRRYLDINPKIPMVLYFPEYEPHFDVSDLISRLSLKNRVTCSMVPYHHGFMNRKSQNFDKSGYLHYLQLLITK